MRIEPLQSVAQAEVSGPARERQSGQESSPAELPAALEQTPTRPAEREQAVSVQWQDGQIMILRFTDRATGNLIQQIPSEEIIKIFRAIESMLQESPPASRFQIDI